MLINSCKKSRKIGKKSLAKFSITILLHFFFLTLLQAQSAPLVDSLKQKLPDAKGENRVTLLCEICAELNYQDALTALPFCQDALKLAQQLEFPKGQASALQYLGTNAQSQSNYSKALDFQKKSLRIFKEINDTLAVANLQNNMGICYDEQGDYRKALENYFAALKVYEEKNEQLSIAQAYNNIGIVYKKQKNYDKVIKYYSKALGIYESAEHGFGQAVTLGNIGSIYLDKKEFQKSLTYSEQSMMIYDSLSVRQYLPYPIGNMGRAYLGLKNYYRAISYLKYALKLHQEFGDKRASAFTQNHLAEAHFFSNELDLAKLQADSALVLATEIGAKDEMKNAHFQLAKIYEQQGDFEKAYQAQSSFTAIKDTLFESEKTKQIAELQTQYETEKKEQTIQLQQLEIEKVSTRNKIILIGGFSVMLAILLMGTAFHFFQKNQQKEVQRLQENAYAQLLLTASINATESERKRIAADLHDGIGQQLTGLKMGWQQLSNQLLVKSPESAVSIKNLTGILDEATIDVRTISHQMMPKTLSEFGLISAMEGMVEKSFSHTSIQYEFDSFGIENRLPESLEIGVFRIAQEAVNNILKHAKASEVSVQLYKAKGNLILTIEDDGIGFENKKSDGHGMLNMQSRAKTMGGEITFERGVENGTILKLKILKK